MINILGGWVCLGNMVRIEGIRWKGQSPNQLSILFNLVVFHNF